VPRQPIVDPHSIDLNHIAYDIDAIRAVNRQRFEMEHLSAIVHLDARERTIVAYKDITEDEFWVRGHIPARPLMPGVVMCEVAAQAASVLLYYLSEKKPEFIGFGGMDSVRFRGTVVPGDRFVMVGKVEILTTRLSKLKAQGFVGAKMVFEGTILGIPVPV